MSFLFHQSRALKFARLLCLCFCCAYPTLGQTSATYRAVLYGGVSQCATDHAPLALTSTSARQCSLHCLQFQDGVGCVAFNYRVTNSSCEMYAVVPCYGTVAVAGCTLYEVRCTGYAVRGTDL